MEIDKKYIIRLEVNGKNLIYTGVIISVDDTFISFKDKFGGTYTYNKKQFISFEEVRE